MAVVEKFREPLNRSITEEEAALIRWLLEHSGDSAQQYIPQVDSLIVSSRCLCGCPSVDFGASSPKGKQLLSDFLGAVNGQDVGVLLFHTDGELCCLDVYSMAGTDQPFGLPKIETLSSMEEFQNHPDPAK